MKAGRFSLLTIAASLLTSPPFLAGQQTDWDRLVADGDSAMAHKQYAQAEDSYREAMNYAQGPWKNDSRLSATLIKLAEACNADGKKDEAESLAHRSVTKLHEAQKKHKPKDASDEWFQVDVSVTVLTKAGELFAANQRFFDAEDLYQKATAIREHYTAEKPPAKPNNEDVFRFIAQSLGEAQPKVADSDDKLGGLYRREGKYVEAVQQYQKSEAIREKQFGRGRPQVAQSLSDIGMCYALQGKYDQAEPLYKRGITILEHNNDREKPEMAVALENYSLGLRKIARDAETKTASDRAQEIRSNLSATSN